MRPWYLFPPLSKTTVSIPASEALFAIKAPDLAGRVLAVLGLSHLAGVGRRERTARVVVDELGVDVHVGAVHREAGRSRPYRPPCA